MTSYQKEFLDLQMENIRMKEQLQIENTQAKNERIKKLENTLHYYKTEVNNLRKKRRFSEKNLPAEHLTVRYLK